VNSGHHAADGGQMVQSSISATRSVPGLENPLFQRVWPGTRRFAERRANGPTVIPVYGAYAKGRRIGFSE